MQYETILFEDDQQTQVLYEFIVGRQPIYTRDVGIIIVWIQQTNTCAVWIEFIIQNKQKQLVLLENNQHTHVFEINQRQLMYESLLSEKRNELLLLESL